MNLALSSPDSFHACRLRREREKLRSRIVQFTATAKWMFTTTPCHCQKNHYALAITQEETATYICPVSLYMRLANKALIKGEIAKLDPISNLIRKINGKEDAFEDRMR